MAKRSKTSRRTPRTTAKASLRVFRLGVPLSITYRHVRGGVYTHKFAASARLLAVPAGTELIVSGVHTKSFIEG